MIEASQKISVEELLNNVKYGNEYGYVPSDFALGFVNFIKLVEDGEPENMTPVVHYKMLDKFVEDNGKDTINLCHRGIAKSTLLEYLILYIAVFKTMPGFKTVPYLIYVSDSIDNGVKKMRKSLEKRYYKSQFLKKYIKDVSFTDIRWEFFREDGESLVVSGYGAKSGVRGTRENNTRPVIALLDDLVSDEDAKSPTVIANIEDTVYKAIDYALHPKKRKIIWNGTPFNAKDPLYKAVESGAWNVNVFPVCEEFPCTEEEFRGSWPDRFDYEYVKRMYQKALDSGKVDTFNQELMLRILSEEDRVISESDIQWYSRKTLIENKAKFNYYITTDFATSEKTTGDFSVISVWACNSNQDWFWVDGIVKRQLMDANIDDLFRLVHKWKPQEVGVEISGQQKGFISWIQNEMIRRNIYFTLASDNNGGSPGIRPVTNKMQRFNVVQPWFKLKKFRFPEELRRDPRVVEFITELTLITEGGFKSKHDDCIDTVSMLGVLRPWYPSEETQFVERGTDGMWDIDDEKIDNNISSYIV